jgi:pyruvate dehydrogenase E2 component (dihydrolipoamide acetyltransferase)
VISPIVRQLARRAGVDLTTLAGTGPNGLITRRDVESAVAAQTTVTASESRAAQPQQSPRAEDGVDRRTGLPIRTRVPLTGLRKAVTETLSRSRSEIPEATTWVDVDATALLDLRAQLELNATGRAPGVLAMVARFVVAGLARHPELNARVDTERGEVVHLDGVNLGLAAQTDRGLVVPAVSDAHRLTMRGLDAEIRRLTTAAREGTATAAELTSGSFTLNNYGVLGVDGSAAIINHPEVAILGLGRIIARPWVVDDAIVVRQIVQLSLVFDHRVCDGGTAGGFLRFVADAIESPTSALADL